MDETTGKLTNDETTKMIRVLQTLARQIDQRGAQAHLAHRKGEPVTHLLDTMRDRAYEILEIIDATDADRENVK